MHQDPNMYILELPTGEKLRCAGFGDTSSNNKLLIGELVFQTGMIGYPEVITDQSFAGQFLVMTNPLIGNYPLSGSRIQQVPLATQYTEYINWSLESNKPALGCLLVSEVYQTENPDHEYLATWLARHGVLGLAGVDTRYLTEYIREHGDSMTRIYPSGLQMDISDTIPQLAIDHYLKQVSRKDVTRLDPTTTLTDNEDQTIPRILVWDFGIKHGQLDCLLKRNMSLDVYPYNRIPDYANIGDITRDYSGIFLSNGPGDPRACKEVIEYLAKLIDAKVQIPIFGICLGHQVLALAAGLQVQKLKYGHRGQNIPCKLVREISANEWGICSIGLLTSQNHGYEVILPDATPGNKCPACEIDTDDLLEGESVPKCANGGFRPLFINANDGSNEGIVHDRMDWFSVQFHPEARPGPRDSEFLFDIFAERVTLRNDTQPPEVEYLDNYVLPIHIDIETRITCIERAQGAYDRWDLGGSQTPKRQPTIYEDKTI